MHAFLLPCCPCRLFNVERSTAKSALCPSGKWTDCLSPRQSGHCQSQIDPACWHCSQLRQFSVRILADRYCIKCDSQRCSQAPGTEYRKIRGAAMTSSPTIHTLPGIVVRNTSRLRGHAWDADPPAPRSFLPAPGLQRAVTKLLTS